MCARCGRGWQTGHAQRVSLHQHIKAGLDKSFDTWPGVFWVSEWSPFLIEAMVWTGQRGQRSVCTAFFGCTVCILKHVVWVWAVLAPGCLYTVARSILKVPMWVIKKARVRLWNTWEEMTVRTVTTVTAVETWTDLYFYDFIKEDLWILLKLQLKVLRKDKK